MNIHPLASALAPDLTAWRRALHAHPELGFEERWTSDFVAEKLSGWGIPIQRGLAGTGVVATLNGRGHASCAIGLRADLDALPIQELNEFAHASQHPGRMHACGHDGHTAMLLGAAYCLARDPSFSGTVHFIFQPGEEGCGGAERMVKEGLFEQNPCNAVYGLHNWPALKFGMMGLRVGPLLASMDLIEILVRGRGGHGALPHTTIDPIVTSAHIVTALQTLVSRSTKPTDAAVVSITCIQGGTAHNVIPETVRMLGTVRSFTPSVRNALEAGIRQIAEGVARSFGASATVQYTRLASAVVNSADEARLAASAAAAVLGADQVLDPMELVMGSEDFSFLVADRPGAYVFLGQADAPNPSMIHNATYDFDDKLLPIGVSYWIKLVEQALPLSSRQRPIAP
ncbi:MAG: M20 aminoacylase family protein [Steroidobacteraceae bacterium]